MKFVYILLNSIILTGCIVLTKKSENITPIMDMPKTDLSDYFKGKDAQISIKWQSSSTGVLSNQANVMKMLKILQTSKEIMGKSACFRNIYVEPSKVEKTIFEAKRIQLIDIQFSINETIDDIGFPGTFLVRAVSFGFYPQKISKKITSELKVETSSGKYVSQKIYIASLENYTSPMNVIPLDLESHPFAVSVQVPEYNKIVALHLKEVAPKCFE